MIDPLNIMQSMDHDSDYTVRVNNGLSFAPNKYHGYEVIMLPHSWPEVMVHFPTL